MSEKIIKEREMEEDYTQAQMQTLETGLIYCGCGAEFEPEE